MRFVLKQCYVVGPPRELTIEQIVNGLISDEQRDDCIRELESKLGMLTQIVGAMAEVLTDEQKVELVKRWGYKVAD